MMPVAPPWQGARLMEPTVLRAALPHHLRPGIYWPTATGSYIVVHDALHPHDERSVVAHERAHHRRGGGIDAAWMPRDWQAVVAREERACDREAAAQLVPVGDLSAWCDEQADVGVGVGPADVAAEWCVNRRLAEAALDNLTRYERGHQ